LTPGRRIEGEFIVAVGGKRGFTLVEVLVALLIAAVCFSVLLNIMVHSKIHQGLAWEMTKASFTAAAIAEKIKELPYSDVTDVPRTPCTDITDVFGTPCSGGEFMEYVVAVEPAVHENMKTVAVTVFYSWAGSEKSICLRMEKLNR
jgi:prepilin-type N-terminal cleavage/methylation domain-containing protein